MSAHIILCNGQCGITRMFPYDADSGVTLEDWTPNGLHKVTLPPDATQALLQALPRETVMASLGEWRPLEQLQACWRFVTPADRQRFLIEMLTPAERRVVQEGLLWETPRPVHDLWPVPGQVCACDGQAGMHVAGVGCKAPQASLAQCIHCDLPAFNHYQGPRGRMTCDATSTSPIFTTRQEG